MRYWLNTAVRRLLAFRFCSGLDLAFGRPRHLAFVYNSLAFTFPVANPTELTSLVTCIDKLLCGTLRAPSAPSVEDDVYVLRDVFHSRVEFAHRNVDGTRDCAVLLQF